MNEAIDAQHTVLAVREETEPTTLALPVVTPAEAREAMRQYLELCESVLVDDDYQEFPQKKKVDGRWVTEIKRFKKKSAVKKLQTYFGVQVEIKDTQRDEIGEGHYGFRVVATARARNGRVVEACGGCSTTEERFDIQPFDDESESRFEARKRKALARAYHDIIATAETRATNRAVMNCIGVGGGEVTAEEVQRDRQPRRVEATSPQPLPTPQPSDEARQKGVVALMALCRERNISTEHRYAISERLFGRKHSADLNYTQLRELYKHISKGDA